MTRTSFSCLCLVTILALPGLLSGQSRVQREQTMNEVNMLVITATYSGVVPGGELADRFGPGFRYGGHLEWMHWPGNWILGTDFLYSFGAKVRENVLAFLQDGDGAIIGRDLSLSNAFLQQRLLSSTVYVGKLFPVVPGNKRSGIRFTLGGGYLRHWIKINDEMRSLPQIEGPYRKGYDRLTAGWATTQFLGYQHVGLNRRINVYAGFDFMQGYTRGRRDYDFQAMAPVNASRLELLYGLRAGISVTLYSGYQAGDIYY